MAGGYRASRRRYLLASLAGAATFPWPVDAANAAPFAADYRQLVMAVNSRYAYFENDIARSWLQARSLANRRAVSTRSRREFAAIVEEVLAGLRDDHVTLDTRRPVRRVPAETDLWAGFEDGAARIDAVRIGSEADSVGVVPGQRVTRVQGIPIAAAVDAMLLDRPFPAARDWALRHLLAGPWSGPFTLEVEDARGRRQLELQCRAPVPAPVLPLQWRRIGERRDLAYLRFPAALEAAFLAQLDALLARLGDARAILLDLRDVNGDSDHGIVRRILGRFVARETPWQVRVARNDKGGARTVETLAPEGVRTGKPVHALVDRWTAGEGEALAAGLAAGGAQLVGTAMAGLRGALGGFRLPASDIVVRLPVERVLLAEGLPREALRPHVIVDLAAPSAGPGDPILYEALKSAG
jgi:C-terminal processing protease CtpA/Prc